MERAARAWATTCWFETTSFVKPVVQSPSLARINWALHACAIIIATFFLWFAYLANTKGAYSITHWLAAFIVVSIVSVVAYKTALRAQLLNGAYVTRTVIGWAIIIRLIAAFTPALFEDDYFRYLWDGYRTLQSGNPYLQAPAEHFNAQLPLELQAILSGVNYPKIPTIYGPLLQHIFALGAYIHTGALWPLKAIFLTVDLMLVAVLVRTFGAARALLYAWSPLVIYEIAVAVHPDGLLGLLFILAVIAARRQQPMFAAVLVGLAAACKPHAFLLVPFIAVACMHQPIQPIQSMDQWVKHIGKTAYINLRVTGVALVALATYLLMWLPYIHGFSQAWLSFRTFATQWSFSALGFRLLSDSFASHLFETVTVRAIAACSIIFFTVGALMWQAFIWRWGFLDRTPRIRKPIHTFATTQNNPRARLFSALTFALGTLLFFTPALNPWYVLWLLPLACGTRWVTPWVAAAVLPLAYATWGNLGVFDVAHHTHGQPSWVYIVQMTVIGLALMWDMVVVKTAMRN